MTIKKLQLPSWIVTKRILDLTINQNWCWRLDHFRCLIRLKVFRCSLPTYDKFLSSLVWLMIFRRTIDCRYTQKPYVRLYYKSGLTIFSIYYWQDRVYRRYFQERNSENTVKYRNTGHNRYRTYLRRDRKNCFSFVIYTLY